MVLHHIMGHELDESLLEDHFLSFLFFDVFFEMAFHGFDFFKNFPHEFNVCSGHLLHKRSGTKTILHGVYGHVLGVKVGVGIVHQAGDKLRVIGLWRQSVCVRLRDMVSGWRGRLFR